MKKSLPQFLKLLSILGFGLLLYPLFFLSIFLFGEINLTHSLYALVWGLILVFLGFGTSAAVNKLNLKGVFKNLSAIVLGVSSAALTVFLFGGYGFVTAILVGMIGAAVFWVSCRLYYREYADILPTMMILAFACINLAAIVVLYSIKEVPDHALDLLAPCFLAVLFIYALVRNQANIDQMMQRRRHNLEHLPKKIRYYNSILLIVLSVVILLLFLFRDSIAGAVSWLGKELLRLLLMIAGGIMRLVSMLFPQQTFEGTITGGELGFAGEEGASGPSFPVELIAILCIVLILFFFRKAIAEKIRLLFQKIKQLLSKTLTLRKAEHKSEYYEDYVHTLTQAERKQLQEKNDTGNGIRKWRKAYRQYQKTALPSERLTKGYQLFVSWLSLKGVDTLPGDTTWEILQKGKGICPYVEGEELTKVYNLFLYRGDEVASEKIALLDSFLKELSVSLK
ncbi:Uncharacterised protein [uncultured Ruminococcus sp.]|nr:Uncharacterised protein [uncultured Ruminococcus sp.]SCH73759.1 Uncharacterised protein [uncultured Clostridium sp.]